MYENAAMGRPARHTESASPGREHSLLRLNASLVGELDLHSPGLGPTRAPLFAKQARCSYGAWVEIHDR